jgi:hypothetical protein
MQRFALVFISIAASLLMAVACAAQQKARTKKSNKRDAPPAPILVAGPGKVLVPSAVRHVGSATIQYLGAVDKTSVFVELPRVYRSQDLWLDLFCSFDVRGKEVVAPESVNLQLQWDTFAVRKDMRLFRNGSSLTFEADGRRFEFKAEQSCVSEGEKCDHTLAQIDFASLQQILNSKSVRVQAEPHAFELSEGELDSLRDLLRAVKPPAGKP